MLKNRRNGVLDGRVPPLRSDRRLFRDILYPLLHHGLRVGIAGLFVYAGFIKLLDPKAFAHSLAQFDLLPDPLLPLVAVGLPALELLAGLGLVFAVRGSLTVILALLGLFVAVLGYAVLLDLDIDCGCFTVDDLKSRAGVRYAFWRDLVLMAATLFLYSRRPAGKPKKPNPRKENC
jgi:uncharacterized membrane protein YphA (DoxX/SURF4 family)